MHIGETLPYGVTVLTPWMRRQADNAVFTFEIIDNPDSAVVTITVTEKNSESYGAGTGDGVTHTFSSGFLEIDRADLMELVRFSIDVEKVTPTNGTGVVYRMLAPTWYDLATPTI